MAAWIGLHLAYEEYFWPGLTFVVFLPLLAAYLTGIRPDVLLAGAVIFGYLVGNRGFAQLSIPGIPMLPGEAALSLGLTIGIWQRARTNTPLIRTDALNYTLLLWIAFCTARLPIDVRNLGFVAVRDFALVYYSLFFFLGQSWAANDKFRRFLEVVLDAGLALTVPIATLFLLSPELFLPLNIAGVPLVFVKGDVAASFMAAGVFWFGANFARSGHARWLALAAVCGAGVVLSNSRAAVVALGLGGVALVVLREKRIVKAFAAIGALAMLALLLEATWVRPTGKPAQLVRLYESVVTVTDFSGTQTPISADLGDKADNNRFRLVWWQAVLEQTAADGLWLGLGFGQDLADQFLRRYYADSSDDFNSRSPHNFLVTLVARTGVVGLLCFLTVLGAITSRALRARRLAPDSGASARWLAPFAIFVSACFGVVLEGPMGAVVFWTVLGLVNGAEAPEATTPADAEVAPGAAHPSLPEAAPTREVVPSP